MPNVPAQQDFKETVRAKAYRTVERNGLVWVYMGDKPEPQPLPQIEANLMPGSEIWCLQRECNWLQALEGDIDTSHVGFLHLGSLTTDDLPADHPMRPTLLDRAPTYEVINQPWGTMYGGCRPNDNGLTSWRVAHFMFPFWSQTPNGGFATRAIARAWVSMDDEHVMLFDITGGVDDGNPAYNSTRRSGEPLFEKFSYEPASTDWFGRWRCADDVRNDWGMNRDSQREWAALHRHRQHHDPGPGRDRKHGACLRPCLGALVAQRPDDRADAAQSAAGRAPCATGRPRANCSLAAPGSRSPTSTSRRPRPWPCR